MNAPPITLTSLASYPVWVGWKEEIRTGKDGKPLPTKVPYNPRNGRKASSTDAGTWAPHIEAGNWVKRSQGDGIGLVLTQVDEMIVGGIDLDTCRDPNTGVIETWAQEVIDHFATYAEVSPSETGVKLFFVFTPTDLPAIKTVLGNQGGRAFKRLNGTEHPPAIELYVGGRYFTVTEKAVNGIDAFRGIDVADLKWLIDHGRKFAGQDKKASGASSRSTDKSRSAKAFREGMALKHGGASYEEMRDGLLNHTDPEVSDWANEKGLLNGERELHKIYDKAKNPQQLVEVFEVIGLIEERMAELEANAGSQKLWISIGSVADSICTSIIDA